MSPDELDQRLGELYNFALATNLPLGKEVAAQHRSYKSATEDNKTAAGIKLARALAAYTWPISIYNPPPDDPRFFEKYRRRLVIVAICALGGVLLFTSLFAYVKFIEIRGQGTEAGRTWAYLLTWTTSLPLGGALGLLGAVTLQLRNIYGGKIPNTDFYNVSGNYARLLVGGILGVIATFFSLGSLTELFRTNFALGAIVVNPGVTYPVAMLPLIAGVLSDLFLAALEKYAQLSRILGRFFGP